MPHAVITTSVLGAPSAVATSASAGMRVKLKVTNVSDTLNVPVSCLSKRLTYPLQDVQAFNHAPKHHMLACARRKSDQCPWQQQLIAAVGCWQPPGSTRTHDACISLTVTLWRGSQGKEELQWQNSSRTREINLPLQHGWAHGTLAVPSVPAQIGERTIILQHPFPHL